MAKSLQDQLLAAGLVDKKKAKKAAKDLKKQDHLQRTGQDNELDSAKQKAETARKEKAARDRELNRQKETEAQKKAIAAQIRQLILTNAVESEQADIKYQFVDGKKVKLAARPAKLMAKNVKLAAKNVKLAAKKVTRGKKHNRQNCSKSRFPVSS